jgi:hypothetical protein
MAIAELLQTVLPRLNLLLVAFLIALFSIMLSRKPDSQTYTKPWKVMFIALILFVVEEVITVMRLADIISYRLLTIHGFLEMGIIFCVIYMFLEQKEFLKKQGYLKS